MKLLLRESKIKTDIIYLNDKTAIVGQSHGQQPNLPLKDKKKIKSLAEKYGAWYEGGGLDAEYTKDLVDTYRGSWDQEFQNSISGFPPEFIYTLFTNVKENDVFYHLGADDKKTIFDLIFIEQPVRYFEDRRFSRESLKKFFISISDENYNFFEMSQKPASEKNVKKFLKIGEKVMWPDNWEQVPNNASAIAKKVNDKRIKYLTSMESGVYFVGIDHLKNKIFSRGK